MTLRTLLEWMSANSGPILDASQTLVLVATLIFTYFQLRSTERSNRAFASLAIMSDHREVWSHLLSNPRLSRILSDAADLQRKPVTVQEEFFVILAINHVLAIYDAHKAGLHRFYEEDLADFLAAPIPQVVWRKVRRYHSPDFVQHVEAALSRRAQKTLREDAGPAFK